MIMPINRMAFGPDHKNITMKKIFTIDDFNSWYKIIIAQIKTPNSRLWPNKSSVSEYLF